MSELHDQLNTLAERGTRRGADAVLAAAVAAASDEVVAVSLDAESPDRQRGRNGRSVFAAGGIAALLGVATLAISALVGGSGADSPEDAVRQLANAISNEDPIAAVDVLDPAEARTLKETLDRAASRAEELEVVEAASAPFAGFDFSVVGLELEAVKLAEGVAKVNVTGGDLNAATDPAGFSDLARRAYGDGDDAGGVDLADIRPWDAKPFVVVVERDGSWYVSTAYTLLEYFRVSTDGPPADFGSGRAAVASLGADSAEAAARDMLDAVATGDWERVLELIPPDEVPVYDYRETLIRANEDASPNWTVESFEVLGAEPHGDATVLSVSASVSYDDYDGERVTVTMGDECSPTTYFDYETGTGCISPYTASGLFAGSNLNGDGTGIKVTAVQRDGRWFLSPVGTALDYVDNVIDRIGRAFVYGLFGQAHLLDPERTITLNEPIQSTGGAHVFAFEGTEGQQIIATFDDECCFIDLQVYPPDGAEPLDSWTLFQGEPLTLPVTGTYKLVAYEYGPATYTIWDADDAPEEAFDGPGVGVATPEVAPGTTAEIGQLTLGQPYTFAVDGDVSVYLAFDGRAGQAVVASIAALDDTSFGYTADLVAEDGSPVPDSSVVFDEPVALPTDGVYFVALRVSGDGAFEVTLRDAASPATTVPGQ